MMNLPRFSDEEEHETTCPTTSNKVLLATAARCSEEEEHDTSNKALVATAVAEVEECDQEQTSASFQDFRQFTVDQYPNLAFLGPASIAIYWFKMYLKDDWIRCNVTEQDETQHKKMKTKHRRRTKGGNFLHIPKVYLNADDKMTVKDMLQRGTAGTHYASSYIQLYNMIRQHATFSRNINGEIHLTSYSCPELPSVKS